MHRGTQNCKKQGGPISTPTGPHPSLAPLGGAAEAACSSGRTARGYQRPVQRVGGMEVVIKCTGEPRTAKNRGANLNTHRSSPLGGAAEEARRGRRTARGYHRQD